jgi:pseudaminic acid biosynthesis-associated methylase
MTKTKQMETWTGSFGRDYTERNMFASDEAFNEVFVKRFGRTKDQLNESFIGGLDRDIRILEVGSNVGNQLRALRRLGFHRLYGVELQRECVDQAHKINPEVDVVEGTAFDIPFKDGFFELVFTNNVLIHISPKDIGRALAEMHRVTRSYIWGSEYYADSITEIPYRGHRNLLWKADYGSLFCAQFLDLAVEREEMLPYLDEQGPVDKMYLLRRPS